MVMHRHVMEMGRVSSHGNVTGQITWEWEVTGHMEMGVSGEVGK